MRQSERLFPEVAMFIGGSIKGQGGERPPFVNRASGEIIGELPKVLQSDLDRAVVCGEEGFAQWKKAPHLERERILKKAVTILENRAQEIAVTLAREHGKPLAEARAEIAASIDVVGWFAGECRPSYGYVIPARAAGMTHVVVHEPVGLVVAFTPWNFPIAQAVRIVAAALAAGCAAAADRDSRILALREHALAASRQSKISLTTKPRNRR